MTFVMIAIWLALFSICRELRLIRKRLGGTLAFWPWNDR